MQLLLTIGLLALFAGTAHASDLPKEMQGLWAFEAGDCSNPNSDGLLKVGAKAIEFYASSYSIKRVVRTSDGAVRAVGFVASEGEAARAAVSLKMRLISAAKLYVLDHAYQRCRGAPQ
jgi:hypothetical protein